MVTGEGQHGVDAKGGGREELGLNGHTGTVTAGHLQNGLHACLLQGDAQTHGGGLQAGRLHIGHIHAVNDVLQQLGGFYGLGEITALGRGQLGGQGKFAGSKGLF